MMAMTRIWKFEPHCLEEILCEPAGAEVAIRGDGNALLASLYLRWRAYLGRIHRASLLAFRL